MNSSRFTRFTPAHQPGDVFVRSDAVTSMYEIDYQNAFTGAPPASAPKVTAIGTTGGGTVFVKESPSRVIEALRAADTTGDVSIEIVMPDEEPVGLRALIDDINNLQEVALLMEQRDEALADAKIADERAEWYKGKAEQMRQCYESEIKRSDVLRAERDQLIAKLKDTTAALEKASAELGQRRYGIWNGDRSSWIACAGDGAAYIKPTPRPD